MIVIEKAKPEDAQGIQGVFHETWLATYPNKEVGITKEDIEEHFKNAFTEEALRSFGERIKNAPPNMLLLIARDDKKIVGVCRVFVREKVNQLQAIYILPTYQQRGIGRLFWNEILGFFDKNKEIIIQVATYNKGAIIFYEHLGFVDTGKRFTEERHRMPLSGVLIPEMEMRIKNTPQREVV